MNFYSKNKFFYLSYNNNTLTVDFCFNNSDNLFKYYDNVNNCYGNYENTSKFKRCIKSLKSFKKSINGELNDCDFKLGLIDHRLKSNIANITVRLQPKDSMCNFYVMHLTINDYMSYDTAIEDAVSKIKEKWSQIISQLNINEINEDIDEIISLCDKAFENGDKL